MAARVTGAEGGVPPLPPHPQPQGSDGNNQRQQGQPRQPQVQQQQQPPQEPQQQQQQQQQALNAFGNVVDDDTDITDFFFARKVKAGTQVAYQAGFDKYAKWFLECYNSTDVYMEGAGTDEVRARIWVRYGIYLYAVCGLRGAEIASSLGAVKHYFAVKLKDTKFLTADMVSTMLRCTGRTTAESRRHAIERAEHAIYPLCDEILEAIREQLWVKTQWDWTGALQRMTFAAILLAIRRGFRVSNYVKVQPGKEDHCMRASDLIFHVRSAVEGGAADNVVASAMRGVDAKDVEGFTTKVYTTKTGESKPTMVSQYTDRTTAEGDTLVDVLVECVQRTGVKEDDELFTAYRQCPSGKTGGVRTTRRVLQRKDVVDSIKNGCKAAGMQPENFSSHSLRKKHATDNAVGGSSSGEGVDLNWAVPKGGRGGSRKYHYDYSQAAGIGAAVTTRRMTKAHLQSLLPAGTATGKPSVRPAGKAKGKPSARG